jgi:hypothetical protein
MEDDQDATRPPMGRPRRITDELAGRLSQAIEDQDDEAFLESFPETFGAEDWGWWAGQTLEYAIERGLVRVVSALLEAGCPADGIDEHGFTTLMHAACYGHVEISRLLLGAGADPDVVAEDFVDGRCALHLALYLGHRDLVDLLEPVTRPEVRTLAFEGVEQRFEDEAEDGQRLSEATVRLFIAAQCPDVEDLRQAIADGADVNAFLRPEASNRDLGRSPLSFAAGRGRPDLVDLLLQAGADPGLPDHLGRTAADFAALNGHHEIARSLGGPPLEDGEGRA